MASSLPLCNHSPHHVFGATCSLRKDVHFVYQSDAVSPSGILLYLAGRYLTKLDISTGERCFASYHGRNKTLSSLTVNNETIYVAESGEGSSVIVCNLQDLGIQGILDGKTHVGYQCLDVNRDGRLLCGVTTDKNLTLWDLDEMQVLLQTKCCNEKVFRCAFSTFDCSMIITAGANHLKMWKLEKTFTGLKLHGEHGKFGDICVRNIISCLQFHNGAILTGTEDGLLLLWIQETVKCIFSSLNDDENNAGINSISTEMNPIHQGGIHCLYYDKNCDEIITGGADGLLKWWPCDIFLRCAHADKEKHFKLSPIRSIALDEYYIGTISFINPCSSDELIIKGDNGNVLKVNVLKKSVAVYVDFHQRDICAIDVSPKEHFCVTGGRDGRIYCLQYNEKKVISSIMMPFECSSISWCPLSVDQTARSFAVGFSDGSLKLMQIENGRIVVAQSSRPFQSRLECIKFQNHNSILATSSDAGQAFLFHCSIKENDQSVIFSPLGSFEFKGMIGSSLHWKEEKFTMGYTSEDGMNFSVDLELVLTNLKKASTNDLKKRMSYKLDAPVKECLDSKQVGEAKEYKQSYDGKFLLVSTQEGILEVWKTSFERKVSNTSHVLVFGGKESFENALSFDGSDNICLSPDSNLIGNITLEEGLRQQHLKSKQQVTSKRKRHMHDIISKLRTEMMNIRHLNSSLQPHVRLTSRDFFLNTFFTTLYHEKMQEDMKSVDSSKALVQTVVPRHDCSQDSLFHNHDCESVLPFENSYMIHNISLFKRDENLIELKSVVESEISDCSEMKPACSSHNGKETEDNGDNDQPITIPLSQPRSHKGMDRKEARKERKLAIAKKAAEYKLMQSPQANSIDKGENKSHQLGSLDRHSTPLGCRISVKEKILTILACEESAFKSKELFNAKVNCLHDRRRSIAEEIEERNARIRAMQLELDGVNSFINCKNISTSVLPQLSQCQDSNVKVVDKITGVKFADDMVEKRKLLEFEKNNTSKVSSQLIQTFDDKLWDSLRDFYGTIMTEKFNELELLTLLIELDMLLEFEDHGKEIQNNLDYHNNNRVEIMKTLNLYESKLEENTLETNAINVEKDLIMKEFDILVPTLNQMRESLFKMFMKGGKTTNLESSMDVDIFDETMYYESEDEGDLCPEECPENLCTEVMNLREKRILIESKLERFIHAKEKLHRTYDLFHSKRKQVEKLINEFQQKSHSFEMSKKHKLNDIIVPAIITTKQIYLWEDDIHQTPMTVDTKSQFVIVQGQSLMKSLQQRWKIVDELKILNSKLLEHKSEARRKNKNNEDIEESILIEKRKCEDLQVLKFGQQVDINIFDQLSDLSAHPRNDAVTDDLRKKLKTIQADIKRTEKIVFELKQEMKLTLNKNTDILNSIAQCSSCQITLNKRLDNTSKVDTSLVKQEVITDELMQLKMTSLRQRNEIETLKKDISCLKRKDGYVYGKLK